jgi:hypothetical protein
VGATNIGSVQQCLNEKADLITSLSPPEITTLDRLMMIIVQLQ